MILVTGGAGYIGSVVVEELLQQNYEAAVIDNLQQGHKAAVLPGAKLIQADCGDLKSLDDVFSNFKINAVMHLAAHSIVSKSVTDPEQVFQNNIVCGLNLLNTMVRRNVKQIVFSSSAAIYGEPHQIPIAEDQPQDPVNPYGATKFMFENILKWYGKAYGIKCISLRYFNAAGASEDLGEDHDPETHLIPNILKAALDRKNPVTIFGNDYPTQDGSCIRDYVHVIDIARAHIKALERIEELSGRAYNLGNGDGRSVLDVVNAVQKVCGFQIPKVYSCRREGDPSILLASSDRAQRELGWKPEYSDLESIVGSAWRWMQSHPDGYREIA